MTLPVAAQAKPIPRDPIQAEYQARAAPVIDTKPLPRDPIQAEYHARAAPVIDTQRVDGASSFDVNQYAVTGFGLALALMAGGLGYAIRHNRRSTLSPA
jgi:cytochrome oxidase assembly protein ShyY1